MESSGARIADYVERRIRQPPPGDCHVFPGSTPVVSFGDIRTARVATVGINPTSVEFTGGHIPLVGQRSVHQVLADCNGYFQRKPLKRWFDQLERILKKFGDSYYDGSACALDLVQWATDPVWSKLPAPRLRKQKQLLSVDAPFLKMQLEENTNIKLVLANGVCVVDELRALSFPLTPSVQSSWMAGTFGCSAARREQEREYSWAGARICSPVG